MLRNVFRDGLVYGIGHILSRGISVILLPLYTRVLLPREYGIIDIFLVVSGLVSVTVAFEISQGLGRHYSSVTSASDRVGYASTALWFTVGTYGIFALLGLLLSGPLAVFLLESSELRTTQFAVVAMAGNGIYHFLQGQLRWQLRPKESTIANIVFSLVTGAAACWFVVVLRTGVVGVFYGQIIGAVVGSWVAWRFTRTSYALRFETEKLRRMLEFSVPLVPASIAVIVALYVDRVAIRQLMSLDSVGIYGVGFRVASVASLVMFGFQTALTPLVYRHHEESSTPQAIARIFRYFLVVAMPVILGLSLFSRELLMVFATPAYKDAAPVVPVIATAILLSSMYIFAPGLAIAKRTGVISLISLTMAATNTALNFLLVPFMGIAGAAMATAVSALLAFTGYVAFGQRLYPIPYAGRRIAGATALTLTVCVLGAFVVDANASGISVSLKLAYFMVTATMILLALLKPEEIAAILHRIGLRPKRTV